MDGANLRKLLIVGILLILPSVSFGYTGNGGIWGYKKGDHVAKNFQGNATGLQQAVDYAGTGGHVRVWPGRFPISSTISITASGFHLEGSGDSTVFYNEDATGDTLFSIAGSNVKVSQFKIDGLNGSRTVGRGIAVTGNDVWIDDVTFVDTPDACIASGVTAGAANSRLKVTNCECDNPGDGGSTDGFGILLSDSDDAEILNNKFTSSSHAAVYVFNDSQRSLVAFNKILSSDDNGIRTSRDSEKARIIGNLTTACAVDGLRMDADSSTVTGNVSVDNTQAGIKTDGTNGGLWEANITTGNDVNGLHINNATTSTTGLVIKGNYSSSNVGAGLNANPNGNDIVGLLVEGNQFFNNSFEGIRTFAGGSASSLTYINNISSGNQTSDVPNLHATNWTYGGFYTNAAATQWISTGGKSGIFYVRAAGDTLRWGTQGSDAVAVVGQGVAGTDVGKIYARSGNSGTTTPRIGLMRQTQIDMHLGADGSNEYLQFRNALIFGLVQGGSVAKMTTAGKLRLGDTTTPTHGIEVTTDATIADSLRIGKTAIMGFTAFANLGTPSNGTVTFCHDCTKATPCAGSGNGAFAKRLNGAWDCD